MVLTQQELKSLVEVKTRSPHQLLGLHPLGDGSGLVARALLPNAAKVEIQPVHEKDKPVIKLKRIPKTDVFEGVTTAANRVYAYDLVITDHAGNVRRTRDAYSFLPTLGEADLYLFGKGDERRIYDKLGAQLRTIDGVPGASFAVWAPNAQRVSVVGDFNNWDGRCSPDAFPRLLRRVGDLHPRRRRRRPLQIRDLQPPGPHRPEDRSLRLLLRDPAQERRHCLEHSQVCLDR